MTYVYGQRRFYGGGEGLVMAVGRESEDIIYHIVYYKNGRVISSEPIEIRLGDRVWRGRMSSRPRKLNGFTRWFREPDDSVEAPRISARRAHVVVVPTAIILLGIRIVMLFICM